MNTKRKLVALLAIAALVGIVNATVFVYYPISVTVSPQPPPVIFRPGTNANKTDLWGETIEVIVEDYGTKLTITVHPTVQRNYYYDIVKIFNRDENNAYYAKFRVLTPITDERISKAYLIVVNETEDIVSMIDLMSSGLQPDVWIELNAYSILRVDLYLELTDYELTDYQDGDPVTAKIDFIYSPTNTEEPPLTP